MQSDSTAIPGIRLCRRCQRRLHTECFEKYSNGWQRHSYCRECRSEIADKNANPRLYDVDESTGCWIWRGAPNTERNPYGRAWVHGKRVMAHRLMYESVRGPIPEGMILDHLCRNPMCVNPDHMEPVTNAINSRRGLRPVLSEEQVAEIRQLLASMTQVAIAKKFGVHPSTVSAIKNERNWKEQIS